MRELTTADDDGRPIVVLVADDAPDEHAEMGIRVGPPSLDALGLPRQLADRLHQELYNRRLLSLADVRRRPNELAAAWQAALKVDVVTLLALYE